MERFPVFLAGLVGSVFVFSLTLSLLFGIPLGVALSRAGIVALVFTGVGIAFRVIFKRYLPEMITLLNPSSSDKDESEEESNSVSSGQDRQTTKPLLPPLEDDVWKEREGDSTFVELSKKMQWSGEAEEGSVHVTKDSFEAEEAAVMAETIRNVIVKDALKIDPSKKE